MNEREEDLTIVLGVFSGRPNPRLELTGAQAGEFAHLLGEVVGRESGNPPPPAKLGLYYGFYASVPQSLARKLAIAREMTIYSGVVTTGTMGKQTHWQDRVGIEAFLADIAIANGFGELLKQTRAEIRRPAGTR
jgi:hypothetical protein